MSHDTNPGSELVESLLEDIQLQEIKTRFLEEHPELADEVNELSPQDLAEYLAESDYTWENIHDERSSSPRRALDEADPDPAPEVEEEPAPPADPVRDVADELERRGRYLNSLSARERSDVMWLRGAAKCKTHRELVEYVWRHSCCTYPGQRWKKIPPFYGKTNGRPATVEPGILPNLSALHEIEALLASL